MKMSSERKKELQAQFKQMKPEMGIFAVINTHNNKCFLETTQNLKGKMNSVSFQLRSGGHPNKELQKDWQKFGEAGFKTVVLEQIEYENDETKTNYSEELQLLKMIWCEKLTKDNKQFY
jgi:hypothetical protein